MTKSSQDIHVQGAIPCQEVRAINPIPLKRIIIVTVDGHSLDQPVRLVIQQHVTPIIYVLLEVR